MTGKALSTAAPGLTDGAHSSRASSPGAAGEDGAEPSAVLVRGLAKRYGEIEAVRGIDFSVHAGETFGFLGPNGAGKSTTINMLCTLVRPTAGVALVAGHDVVRERDEVRRNIGLVFQDTTLDGYLSAEQNLRLHAELYGVPRSVVNERMHQVMRTGSEPQLRRAREVLVSARRDLYKILGDGDAEGDAEGEGEA